MASVNVYLRPVPSDANRNDLRLYDPTQSDVGGFPGQFGGLFVRYGGVSRELSMVALADAPAGAQWRISKNGVTYAVYLVDTTDPNASAVRIRTPTAIKAARLKT
jgi:hypothetical protein